MNISLQAVVRAILDQYALPINGDHGVTHWARVLENGRRLTQKTGANLNVVSLFAVFHDSRRVSESIDPDHGPRGAELASQLRESLFELDDHDFKLLYIACLGHTRRRTHPDITIQTCWDSDRLDLGRVGATPHPSRLCTQAAKDPATIHWAHVRACFRIVPDLVSDEWGIALGS